MRAIESPYKWAAVNDARIAETLQKQPFYWFPRSSDAIMFMRNICALQAIGLICALVLLPIPASATGTLRVQQHDGSAKTYKNAYVRVKDAALAVTSNDGEGMLVIGKAACTQVGNLLRCIAYDATLDQYGRVYHIPLQTGRFG